MQLVESAFGELNARPKPAQPTKSVRELTALSVKAQPLFNELMAAVGAADNAGSDGQGGQVPPGGVSWQPAPLKKAQRIGEKLAFDPAQRERVLARPCRAETLDASGMLDTVRGMFVCNSMEHALAVLRLLVARFDHSSGSDKGQARLERSKDRFAQPSGGGWMGCLLNIGVNLGGDGWLIGEVQIVHRQLLVVRAELGAHHGYGIYRAALEMLEATGNLALATGDEHALRELSLRTLWQPRRLSSVFVAPAIIVPQSEGLPRPSERSSAFLRRQPCACTDGALPRHLLPLLFPSYFLLDPG